MKGFNAMPEAAIFARKYLIHSELYENGEMISQYLVYEASTHSEGVEFMIDNYYAYLDEDGNNTLYMTHPN